MFAMTYAVMWIVTIFNAVAIMVLVREVARLRNQAELGFAAAPERLPLSSSVPPFTARELKSGTLVAGRNFAGQRSVFLFLSTDCSTCAAIADGLRRWSTEELRGLAVFCNGEESRCRRLAGRLLEAVPVLRNADMNVFERFRLKGFPVAVLIDETSKIAGFRYPSSAEDVHSALETIATMKAPGHESPELVAAGHPGHVPARP
jgi:hypothetical protein